MAGVINGNGHRSWRGRNRPNADINITPMVDVMLVLLIIFMVTAPLLVPGVTVDLPKTRAPNLPTDKDPLTISITKDAEIFLGGSKQESEATPLNELAAKVGAIAGNGYDQRILVRGDKSVDYGTVMEVMGELKAAGFRNLGLVTDPVRGEKKKSK